MLTCSLALFTALLIGTLTYLRTREITRNMAYEGLAGETRLMALQFKSTFDRMRNDAFIVLRTPPVKGLIRSLANNDEDPLDGSTTTHWRKRLETIFISVMQDRPSYTQMRYIGVAQNGRELVRVNRVDDSLFRMPTSSLQQKGGEPYFKAGIKLKRDGFYFSEVSYNKEHGKRDLTHTPTLRVVLPVYDESNRVFGLIVINAHYGLLLQESFEVIQPRQKTFIVNNAGDYIQYDPSGAISQLQMHGSYTITPPSFIEVIKTIEVDEIPLQINEELAYFTKLRIDPENPGAFLGVILSEPADTLLQGAQTTRYYVLLLTGGLLIVALVVTAFVARWFTRPLNAMTRSIIEAGQRGNNELPELPEHLEDEIGELARAFKRLTSALRNSEIISRSVLENANDGIITIDEKSFIKTFNPASEKLFGYASRDVVGSNVKVLMPEPYFKEHDGYVGKYLYTGEKRIIGKQREVKGKRKDGSTFPMELSVSEMLLGNTHMFIGIIRDITDRRKAEAERERLIRKLVRSNEELDSFAYIASHDLKEPLRAIHNHSRFLLEDHQDKLGEDGERRLHRLLDLTKRLEKLVDDLLYFSRIGREELAIKPTDLNEVINDVTSTMEDFLLEKNALIEVHGKLPTVTCDGVRITELYRNLITNAIKYNDREQKRVEVGVCKDDDNVLYVKDNGIGIAPEFHQEVFRIFKRLNSEKVYGEGTGSGLTFVQKIVERHGGKIWIQSAIGQGTTFFFTLKQSEIF